jgi:hypothetical protein
LIDQMIERIEAQAAQRRAETSAVPLGPAAIKAQHPHHRPSKLKKSPAPLFHAATRRIRRELYDAYRFFLAAFREASERLRLESAGTCAALRLRCAAGTCAALHRTCAGTCVALRWHLRCAAA